MVILAYKRVFNKNTGHIEIVYNIDVTSYTPANQTGPNWLFDYDSVFTSFNIPIDNDVGTSGIEHTILDNDENVDISPRSSVQIDEESGVTTEAEVLSTGTIAEQDSELVTPV